MTAGNEIPHEDNNATEQQESKEEKGKIRTIIAKAASLYQTVASVWTTLFKVFVFILIIVLIVSTVQEIFSSRTIFNPFKVPKILMEKGYTGEVVTLRLRDEMNALRKEIQQADSSSTGEQEDNSGKSGQDQGVLQQTELDDQMDIEVPGVGLSLRAVTLHIIRAVGIQPNRKQVNGYILKEKNKEEVELTVQVSGKSARTFEGNMKKAIVEAAKYLLKILEPQELGMIYYSKQDNKKLASLIQHVWQNSPSTEEKAVALLLQGCLAKIEENMSRARKKIEAAKELDDKNTAAWYMYAEILGKDGKNEDAEKAFKKARKLDKKNIEVYIKWAEMLANNNKHKEADKKYKEALKKSKDNENDKAMIYVSWAGFLSLNNKHDEAVEKYNKAISENPASITCYLGLGRILQWDKNDPEQALRIYQDALLIDDRNVELYDAIGSVLINNLKREEKGLSYYEKAVEKNEKDYRPYLNLAWTLINLQQYENAIEKFNVLWTESP